MKVLLVVFLVGAASAFVERAEWEAFKQQHAKSYVNPIEEFYRMKVYADNKVKVQQHMKEYAEGKHTFTLALNKFADLTSEEFARGFKGLNIGSTKPHQTHQASGKMNPAEVDWRNSGAVTDVKYQSKCGSSWAFAAIGSLEGVWALAGNSLVSLSVQQLLDCSSDYGNSGCMGGWMDSAFDYIRDNGGIMTEDAYPYIDRDGSCKASGNNVATVSSYVDVQSGSESDLEDAVANAGPVSVAIDATQYSFQLYSGGVYNDDNCSRVYGNHGALVVGYGTESGSDYWLVKNTWGTDWGVDGYIKMTRNSRNQCGIANTASYPVV